MNWVFRSSFSIAIPTLIFWNVLVWFLWLLGGADSLWMQKHFLVSWEALQQGRLWTLLTSAFSHQSFLHLFVNMYVLSGFGKPVEALLGVRRCFRFYVVAGLVAALAHAFTSSFYLGRPDLPALGASGSVAGVVLFFALVYPQHRIYLLGLIPVPALVGALAFVGLDIWGLVSQAQGHGLPIGHGAHLGGAFTGLLYFFFLRKELAEKKRRKEARSSFEDFVDVSSRRVPD